MFVATPNAALPGRRVPITGGSSRIAAELDDGCPS